MDQILKNDFSTPINSDTEAVLHGLVDAMEMEGTFSLKPPCFGHEFDNPHVPTCWHGSAWSQSMTQKLMAGEFPNKNISILNDDDMHRVDSVSPVHLPHITADCDKDTKKKCEIKTFTVSEPIYDFLDKLDTGFYPIAASEIRTKISSRQNIMKHAGYDLDFHETDEVGNRCAEINHESINWAYQKLSPAAKKNYDKYG